MPETTTQKRPRRLPDFKTAGEFTIDDAKAYSVSVVNARILLHELPLFGDHEGSCFFEPWPEGRWHRGWGEQGESGMSPVAVAATHAFLTAVSLPLSTAHDTPSTSRFVPSIDGAAFLQDDALTAQLPAILVTALAAIQNIHGRAAGDDDDESAEEVAQERVVDDMSDFGWMLAVNLAKTTSNIARVKDYLDVVMAESVSAHGRRGAESARVDDMVSVSL